MAQRVALYLQDRHSIAHGLEAVTVLTSIMALGDEELHMIAAVTPPSF